MAEYKYKKGDKIANGKGKIYGEIVKEEKTPDDKNKYEILNYDGSPNIELLEGNIIENEWHKKEG